MKHKTLSTLSLVVAAAALTACGEKPQEMGGTGSDAAPYTGVGQSQYQQPGWKVGDKTGTSGDSGTANDIGVLWPPGGGAPVLVTCYLTRSTAPAEQRDAAIAQVARAVVAARQG